MLSKKEVLKSLIGEEVGISTGDVISIHLDKRSHSSMYRITQV